MAIYGSLDTLTRLDDSDRPQVKTQHGVPSQPTGLRAIDVTANSVTLEWARPHHTEENVVSYELYWNDTFSNVKFSHSQNILILRA